MWNNFVVVGIVSKVKIQNNKNMLYLTIPRNFKNSKGKYDKDYVKIQITNGISNTLKDYCSLGSIIGNNVLTAEKLHF